MEECIISYLPKGFFENLKEMNNILFTTREIDIIASINHARGNSKIASILDISPRTVETYIIKIKRKINRNSKEGIIDFVERSGKYEFIRKHYQNLLINADFNKNLKSVANTIDKNNLLYYFISCGHNKKPIIAAIKNHIEIAGIQIKTCSIAEKIVVNKKEDHFIYVISNDFNQQRFIIKALQEHKTKLDHCTFILVEEPNPILMQELEGIPYINFIGSKNYYLTIIEVLKRLSPNCKFDSVAANLTKYQKSITGSENLTIINPSVCLKDKTTININLLAKLGVKNKWLIIILFIPVFILGLNMAITQLQKKINTELIGHQSNHKHIITNYLPEILTSYEQFVGREKELKQIEKFLKHNNIAVITGRGGIGKSSCAIEYGKHNKNDMLIRHFNAESINKLDQQYQDLARELEINTGKQQRNLVMQLINNKLSKLPAKILFILDNVAQYEDVKEYLANFPKNIQTIITTRLPMLATQIPHLALEEFSNEEAEQYLKNSLQHRGVNKGLIYNLIESIGTLPYDIKCIAAYLLDHLAIDQQITANHVKSSIKNSLLVEFVTSHDHIKQQAWKILQYISFLDPDFIGLDIIKKLFPKDTELSSKALKKLESLSLISIINNQNNQVGIKIHRNLQKNIQSSLKYQIKCLGNQQRLTDQLLATLNQLFPEVEFTSSIEWQTASSLTPHIEKLLEVDKILNQKFTLAIQNNKINIANLAYKLAKYYLIVTVNYAEAFKYAQLALDQMKTLYSYHSSELGNIYYIIGVISRKLGNILEGLTYSQQGLTIRQKIYAGDHPDVADSLYSVGNLYNQNGELEQGLKYSQMALDMYKRLYPKSHPKIGYSLNVVGVCYIDLGDFEKSLEHFKAGFKIFTTLDPINYEGAATLQSNIAYSYNKLGDHVEAVKNAQAAVDIFIKLYPNGHPRIVYSLNDLGESLINTNKIKKGLSILHQALDMSKKFGMDKHCATIFVLDDLGAGYLKKKDYKKALEYTEKAFNLRKERYGTLKNHPSLAQSLYNLGDIYCSLLDKDKGLQSYRDALKIYKELSLEHLAEVNEIKKKITELEPSSNM